MGNYDSSRELSLTVADALPDGLYVIARETYLDALRDTAPSRSFDASVLVPLDPGGAVPLDIIASATVLVMEIDPANAESLARIAQVRSQRPDLPIIAALHEADVTLVRTLIRQGIADVAVLPFVADELASQVLDVLAGIAERSPKPRLAPLFAVARSTGGCGTTTIITHLAAAFAKEHGRNVCVVDLDLQNGDVATYLGEAPGTSITDLIDAGDRLDDALLSNAISITKYGFSIIAAPDVITPLDIVGTGQIIDILNVVRRRFDLVIVDLPANWTNWALSIAVEASELLLVTDLSISSLRQARRRLQLFATIGLERNHTRVVVNRLPKRLFKTIDVPDVNEALGCKVIASLALEGPVLRAAQDQGVLVSDLVSKCRFTSDILALAGKLIDGG